MELPVILRRNSACLLWTLLIAPLCAGATIGRTSGAAFVTPDGEATYSIPIALPPGTNGMTPDVSLEYRHRMSGGLLGVGWSIGGLSQIGRCPRTFAQDGVLAQVTWTAADRFCLDGQRLVVLNGVAYGTPAAEYRTEIESFSRIRSFAGIGVGPQYFTVEAPDGRIFEYGATPDSRIDGSSAAAHPQVSALIWALNRIRDRSGNVIDFSYSEGPGAAFRIATIRYNSNPGAGVPSSHEVRFIYEDRPSNEVDTTAVAGVPIRQIVRLNRMELRYNDTVLRRYDLSYEPALSVAGRSRLASIMQCAAESTDCLSQTTFAWQNGTAGFSQSMTTAALNTPQSALPSHQLWNLLDTNGDGRSDVVWAGGPTMSSATIRFRLGLAGGSFGSEVDSGIPCPNGIGTPFDANGDARTDLLTVSTAGAWTIIPGAGAGFGTAISTGIAVPYQTYDYRGADMNGDGLGDIAWSENPSHSGNALAVKVRYALPAGGFAAPATLYDQATTMGFEQAQGGQFLGPAGRRIDLDGDGAEELLMNENYSIARISTSMHATDYFDGAFAGAAIFDFNGDGCSDFAYEHHSGPMRIRVGGCGVPWSGPELQGPSMSTYPVFLEAHDWNSDGREDLLLRGPTTWHVAYSNGDSMRPLEDTGVPHDSGAGVHTADLNGDGLRDLAWRAGNQLRVRWRNGPKSDLLLSAVDGFGVRAQFNYGPLTDDAIYTKGAGAAYPVQDVQSAAIVVRDLAITDGSGSGSLAATKYTYEGMRQHLLGRGSLGFSKRTSTDQIPGERLRLEETRRQDYPLVGLPATTVLRQESGEPIAASTLEWTALDLGAGPAARYFPRVVSATSRYYQVGGALNGAELASVVRTIAAVDPTSGLTTDETTAITEVAGGANAGSIATIRTQRSGVLNDAGNWCLGRPQSLQMTASHSLPGGSAITRTASSAWDGPMCRPTQQRIEPGNSQAQITYNLTYDAFGNLSSRGVTGIGMSKRTTSVDWGTRGQLPSSSSNALAQLTLFSWNPATGQLLGITDPNGITAAWSYDAFGNPIQEVQPDGTSTIWSRIACPGSCDPRMRFRVMQHDRDNTGATRVISELDFDQHDRGFRSAMQQPGGGLSVQLVDSDSRGRVLREHLPHWNGSPAGYRQLAYDPIGRLTDDVLHEADGNTSHATHLRHDGHSATQIDALGRTTTGTRSAWGNLVRVTDAAGNSTNYEYDAFGNLVRVRDPLSNIVDTIGYSSRGLKLSHDNVDAGYWTWTRNALGEPTSMRDTKFQLFNFSYDKLGRLTSRAAPDGTMNFVWGNNAAAHNIGRLASHSSTGFTESFLYDSTGRPSRRTIITDSTYRYDYSYDSLGLLDVMTYPSTGSGPRFAIRHEYDAGRLARIRTADAAGTTLWLQNARDAAGNMIDESLGAAARVVTGFDPQSGELDYRQSTAAGNTVQDLAYSWDANGNLLRREDRLRNRIEEFQYDVLDRLNESRRNGIVNLALDYDAIGNIRHKSDVCAGTAPCYSYDSVRKHAVTSAAGQAFAYDPNGNMTSRGGSAIAWTSDNLPVSIAGSGGNSSQFWYGPVGNRWKQVATHAGTTETTLYGGELTEKVARGGITTWRQYVMTPTGVAAVRLQSGASASMRYLTHDHLGSTDGILDAAGNLLVSESFAPFGMRQGAQSGGAVPSADIAVIGTTTRDGFTGHEHLDNLDLIHMNGRVYDPKLGRFISADPHVIAPFDAQSLNRYSYVWNNPLSFVDPSGFNAQPSCVTAPNGRCAQVTIWGRKRNMFFRFVGGAGYAQHESAAARDPCGQDSNSLACALQNSTLTSPSQFGLTVGTKPDPTLSGNAALDYLQGAAARVGNIAIGSSPLTWLFGADSEFEWFGVPDSGAGQAGADFGDLAVLAGGAAGMIRKFGTEAATASPSAFARSLQGTRNYPHIDHFKDIILKKGTLLFSGFPGQSAFYTTASAIRRSQGSAGYLFDGLQVMLKEKYGGHRARVAMYEVLEDTKAAFGLALKNSRHGPGGLPQLVVPEFQSKLRYILDFALGP